MATHSRILAWRIPWTEEPGGLQSIGSQRVRRDWSDLRCTHAIYTYWQTWNVLGFPGGSESKESACNVEDPGSIPGSGRSFGEEDGNPLQYSRLENSMDRRAWLANSPWGLKRVDRDLAIKQQWTLESFCLLKIPHWDWTVH